MKKLESILLFLTVLFLPTQLGRHFWPEFSYIYSLKIDYLSPTVYFWDLLVVFLISAFIIQIKPVNKVALNLWLTFILVQLLSIFPNLDEPSNLARGLVRGEQYMIAGLFGVYLASVPFKSLTPAVFWGLTIAVLGQAFIATAQFLKSETLGLWVLGERAFSISTPAISKFDFYGRQFLRPYATFPHPNVLAAFMVISISLLALIRSGNKNLTILAQAAGALAALLTVSRTALIALLIEAFVLIKRRGLIWLTFILIILAPFIVVRFSAIFTFDNLTLLRREEQSEVALKLWLSHPVFGVGVNNFISEASDELLVGPSRFLQPVHNIFLLVLAETGLIGLLGLLVLIGFPIFRLLKLRTPNPRTLLLIWGVIIFLGLFDHYFLTLPQGYRLLFLVWGISLSMLELKGAKAS